MTSQKDSDVNYVLRVSEAIALITKIQDQLLKISQTYKNGATLSSFSPMMSQWYASQKAIMDATQAWLSAPEKAFQDQMRLAQNYMEIWQKAFLPPETPNDEAPLGKSADKRFQDQQWQTHPFFKAVRDSYLATQQWSEECLDGLALNNKAKDRARFAMRQFMQALAPSNIWYLNPTVIEEAVRSGGENFIKGLKNFLKDLEKGQPMISMVDGQAFNVGTNIAITKGAVVFENDLLQLIQYAPSTKQVYERPVFILSPWINKYYILDMRPENSFVKWLTDQGYTVYITSWVNPDHTMRETDFEDYLQKGLLEPVQYIRQATKTDKVNCVGYCIGGTLLSMGLSYAKTKNLDWFGAATFLTTLLDFSHAGELGLFIDDEQLTVIEDHMTQTGMMEAAQMHLTFNMLRASDLIWSFVINNYLLGKEPFPFDLLYWNSDSTNLPAKMHTTYLRQMYLENNLIKANKLTMLGVPIDLTHINHDCYFLSASEDHIAPWKATYASAQLLTKAKTTFVLASSGHIAGVVNHPSKNKGQYQTHKALEKTPDAWLKNSTPHQGSWWTHWEKWLSTRSGQKVASRNISSQNTLEHAPGRYVKKRALKN